MIVDTLAAVLAKNALITAFVCVGMIVWLSYFLSAKLTRGHLHGSAVAIAIGLMLAWLGGTKTGGSNGLADFTVLSGIGVKEIGVKRRVPVVFEARTAFGQRPHMGYRNAAV